jgi:hypothetical protein
VQEFERGLEGTAQAQKTTGSSSAQRGKRTMLPTP